jgi:hypothetical protein
MKRALLMSLLAMTLSVNVLSAQYAPVVTMALTLPDGRTTEVAAPESRVAEFTLSDGTLLGVRPTILDAKPWTRVVVTVFRMPTADHGSEEIGAVEAKTGGDAVRLKGGPALSIRVKQVSEESGAPNPTTR